jgi:hypothetical protein
LHDSHDFGSVLLIRYAKLKLEHPIIQCGKLLITRNILEATGVWLKAVPIELSDQP